jgi:uncharacterized repeat protein (TIGR03803 family)
MEIPMTKQVWKWLFVILSFCAVTAIASPAQTFTTLKMFAYPSASSPSSLMQAADGNFYLTSSQGGIYLDGTIFKITPGGKAARVREFCYCVDGRFPEAALVLGTDRNFYGTTSGGDGNAGTVFKFTPADELTTLYTFQGSDGASPNTALILAADGNFYGTTSGGGANGDGTVFMVTSAVKLTTLYSFSGADGANPAGLVEAPDGNFYGTTDSDGDNGSGTVFKITPSGALTTLYSFCSRRKCADGSDPSALIQGTDGNFYGTTNSGGAGGGTAFKITSEGKLTTLYTFCAPTNNCATGFYPSGGLVQGTDGNFYGVNSDGGDAVNICTANGHYGCGTVFSITPTGDLTTLHEFEIFPDGFRPSQKIIQGTDGNFYSTTGGSFLASLSMRDFGTVWSLSMGLAPFVSFVNGTAEVGHIVHILGQGLDGTSGVSFNGISASFAIDNDTYLTATVPNGATSGPVTVTTRRGVLTSNVPFRVRQ